MRVATVVGTRPQYVKLARLGRLLAERFEHVLIDTGQHYDYELSGVFSDELSLPRADQNLAVGSRSHAQQLAAMLVGLEEAFGRQRPDMVVVLGDTNSTFAGALTASRMRLAVAHVEAGPREGDIRVPEEANRRYADLVSDLRFAPTRAAYENLVREGLGTGSHFVGDVMYDALIDFRETALGRSTVLATLSLQPGHYVLVTMHHTDDVRHLDAICKTLLQVGPRVVWPLHPRTRANLAGVPSWDRLQHAEHFVALAPASYLDFLALEANAGSVLTDSGGVQKEAFLLGVPCVVAYPSTPWPELADLGWLRRVDYDSERIIEAVKGAQRPAGPRPPIFGDGNASEKIVELIERFGRP